MPDPMIKPEPDSFDALLRELLVERFLTTDRDRLHGHAATDTPTTIGYRQRVLCEALESPAGEVSEATVLPLRREQRRAA